MKLLANRPPDRYSSHSPIHRLTELYGQISDVTSKPAEGGTVDDTTIVEALLLGILEGLTEFIPVSSTGHILLAGHFLGFESTGKAFEILIQLGAILAILSVYAARLWKMALDLPRDRATQRFVLGVLLAFLPAAVIGVLAYKIIKTVLFETLC